jgi:hypothetical protein
MKSNIITFIHIVFLSIPFFIQAQTSNTLVNQKWIVAEYGISKSTNYGTDPLVKPEVIFFSKDSVKNNEDYSNIEMDFFSGGTYLAKNVSNKTYNGIWHLNATGDSLTTDSITYKFNFINAFTCITFNMTVQVVDTLGTQDTLYSYIKMLGIMNTTSIHEAALLASVNVYPVPAKDELNLEFASNNFKEARLYNVLGQLLQTIPLQGKQSPLLINMENKDSGYYSLELISTNGLRVVKKVIKE